MTTILLFLIFYFAIYFYGRGFIRLFKISSFTIFKIPVPLFYPIVGLFFIGNVSVLLNFFVELTNPFARVFLISLFFLNLIKSDKTINIKNKLIQLIIIPGILAISSLGVGLAGDAGLYHLNHQEWLRSSKVVFGLVNAHFRFGFSSISEWIGANFWINENLLLLHFLNLIYLVFFFQVAFHYIFNDKDATYRKAFTGILIVGFLDNFGFNGGKNGFVEIEAVTKSDTVFAVLFFLTTIFIFEISKKSSLSRDELFILSLLSLLTFQYRIFGALTILFYFFVMLRKKHLQLSIQSSVLQIAFLLTWIVKNFINTACLFYPIKSSCFDMPFSATKNASVEFALYDLNNVHTPLRDLNISNWFSTWIERDINQTVLYNMFFTMLVLVIYSFFIYKKSNIEEVNTRLLLVFVLLSFTAWILSSPGIRLGIGILLLLYIVIPNLLNSKELRFSIVNNKILLLTLFFSTLLLVPQVNNHRMLIENISSFEIRQMKSQNTKYVSNPNGFGVVPENNSDKCWVNTDCIRNQDEIIKVLNNGYVFIQAKN
tara:strand:+ start:360 stop:1985 length:1626 start_codon:yes stop_codon:yes gene_type:complete